MILFAILSNSIPDTSCTCNCEGENFSVNFCVMSCSPSKASAGAAADLDMGAAEKARVVLAAENPRLRTMECMTNELATAKCPDRHARFLFWDSDQRFLIRVPGKEEPMLQANSGHCERRRPVNVGR